MRMGALRVGEIACTVDPVANGPCLIADPKAPC